jgi:hypothetical protein
MQRSLNNRAVGAQPVTGRVRPMFVHSFLTCRAEPMARYGRSRKVWPWPGAILAAASSAQPAVVSTAG